MFEVLNQDVLWVSILCAGGAAILIGIAKAGFGGAIGIVAVPLMAVAMPIDVAVGVMLPVLITGDFLSLIHHRGHVAKRPFKLLLTGMVFGVAIGTGAWWWLGESPYLKQVLNLLIGGLCVLFVGYQFWQMRREEKPGVPDGAGFGVFSGLSAAVVSTLAHSAGPVVSLYMLAQRVDKRAMVGTMVWFFTILNLTKLPTFVAFDLVNMKTLAASWWLVGLVPLGTVAGYWMHKRVAERPFAVILYVTAVVAAVRMIWKGIGG